MTFTLPALPPARLLLALSLVSAAAVAHDMPPAAAPQPGPTLSPTAQRQLDAELQQIGKDWKLPGLAVAVVNREQVLLLRGYGLRQVEPALPMTPDTLVPIGSATKAFSAALIASLVEEGKLDWQAPVRRTLKDFELQDPWATAQANLLDLSTHRTGMPRYDALWIMAPDTPRAEIVRRLRHLPPNQGFRAGFQYNNLMVTVAGHAAEVAAGQPWELLMQQRLLQPLGMRRAGFGEAHLRADPDHAEPYQLAEGGRWQHAPDQPLGETNPAGGLHASAREMAAWVQLQLNQGRHQQHALLKPESLALLHTPATVSDEDPSPEVTPGGYAPGWFVDAYRGHRRLFHTGIVGGYVSSVTFFPDQGVGFALMANLAHSSALSPIGRSIADRLLGLSHQDWSQQLLKRLGGPVHEMDGPPPKALPGTRPSLPLAAYAGRYRHPGLGEVRIELEGDHLTLVCNGRRTALQHLHYDRFVGEGSSDEVWDRQPLGFELDEDGQPRRLSSAVAPGLPELAFERVKP